MSLQTNKKHVSPLLLFSLLLFAGFLPLAAQNIQGRVIDDRTNLPLEGANLWIEGSTIGATTGENGEFSIFLPEPGEVRLAVSYLGYDKLVVETAVPKAGIALGDLRLNWRQQFLNAGVVVTAKRAPRPTFELPEAVGIRSGQDLINDGARTVPEALIGMTGVWVQKTNHGSGSPFVRGLTGNQTLLLIDGIRLNNSTYRYGPNQYFVTIDPLAIDRIEVLRGAGSVLYGSDALGGAIQVFTPESAFSDQGWFWEVSGFGRVVSQNMEKTSRANLELSGEKVSFLGGFTLRDFGDLVAGKGIGRQAPSSYTEWAADAKLRFKLGQNSDLTLAYNGVFQSDVDRYDQVAQRGFAIWQFDPQDRQLAYARLRLDLGSDVLDELVLTTSYQHSLEGRESRRVNSRTLTLEEDEIGSLGLIAELHSSLTPNWRATSGVEFYQDQINSSTIRENIETGARQSLRGLYPNNSEADNIAVFSMHTYDLGRLSLHAGARFNQVELRIPDTLFGSVNLSPSALVGSFSARYTPHPNHALTASVNTGFRAPNVNDLSSFGSFDFGIEVPGSQLEPERSTTYELGYKLGSPQFGIGVAAFYTNLSNLITRTKGLFEGQATYQGDTVYLRANTSEAFLRGLETEIQYRLSSNWSIFGNLTYTYGQDLSNDEPLRRIPPLNGRVALSYRTDGGLFAELEYLYAGRQDRLAAGDRSDHRINPDGTPAWNLVNLKVGFFRWDLLQLNAGLNNLFDEAYRIHGSGVDGPGRNVWVSARLAF